MVAVAVREELVRPGVMAVIEDLVAGAESGVLEIEGNPSGQIYLEDGHITFARASWVPGLAARLRAIAPSLDNGESPPSQETDDAITAGLVLRHGYVTMARLHEIIESIVVDAFLVLTIPLMADSPVAGIHFRPAVFTPTELFPRLTLDLVRGEAIKRAEEMAEYGLAPTTAVAPRDLAASATVLTREQWAVACQIGDRVSARELAMRRGASLSDTVQCLGSLVSAGLCAPVLGGRRGLVAPSAVPRQDRRDGQVALPAAPPRERRNDQIAPAVPPPARRAPKRAASKSAPPAVPPQARRAPRQATPKPAPPAVAPPARRAPKRAALEAAPAPVSLQPRRVPGTALELAGAHRAAGNYQPPSVDVLRQVLSGLRKL